jgi:hypothetical protein
MIFSCPCPNCGTKKEYVSEEAGELGHCLGCGTQFVLKKQTGTVVKHVAIATLAVMLGVGAVGGRSIWNAYSRAQVKHRFWEAEREEREANFQRRFQFKPEIPTERVIVDDRVNPP